MKVAEIITKLQNLDPDTEVQIKAGCAWDDGFGYYDHTYNNWLSDKYVSEDKENNTITINLEMDATWGEEDD